MAEILRTFDEPVRDQSGSYYARVVGRLAADRMWEGWLEFISEDATQPEPLTTAIESRQPERDHLEYWASGLTPVYAEGALSRARRPVTVRTRIIEEPLSDRPAVKSATRIVREVADQPSILNPFDVGSRSLDVLAQELGALGRGRLLRMVAVYELNPGHVDLSRMTDSQLIRFIVTGVQARLAYRAG